MHDASRRPSGDQLPSLEAGLGNVLAWFGEQLLEGVVEPELEGIDRHDPDAAPIAQRQSSSHTIGANRYMPNRFGAHAQRQHLNKVRFSMAKIDSDVA